jgi:hypothetical protein
LFVGPSAPICLEFGSDILPLNEDYPGKQGTWNFQVTVQANNTMPDTSIIHGADGSCCTVYG